MAETADRDEGLKARLRGLPREARPAVDQWPAITSRLGAPRTARRGWRGMGWTRAAAAAVIFVAGAVGGFAVGQQRPPSAEPSLDDALALASEVQRTGSEYVAALAAFAATLDSLNDDARVQGREAAVATLYGAATQLAALSAAGPARSAGPPREETARAGRRVRF